MSIQITPESFIAGVDEAGRGALAGPVVVAAVVLNPQCLPIKGLNDSKKLTASRREQLFERILEHASAHCIVSIHAQRIDQINILQATLEGMRQAVEGVMPVAQSVLIDGNCLPTGLPCPAQALIGGDALEPAIMAASILAKVSRDRYMRALHLDYPDYGFDRHKGYPTAAHRLALKQCGPCPQHRRSFAPVRACSQAVIGI